MKAKLGVMLAMLVAAVAILAIACGSSGTGVTVEKGLAAAVGQYAEEEAASEGEVGGVPAAMPVAAPLGTDAGRSAAAPALAGGGGEMLAPTTSGALAPLAQGVVGGLSVQGFGRATAPADSARVQFVVTKSYDYYYEYYDYPEPLPDERSELIPEEETAPGITPEIYSTPVPPMPLTEEDLEPLIEAIKAEAISESDIEVTIYSAGYYDPYYYGGEDTARVTVTLRDTDKVGPVVEAGTTAMEMAMVTSSIVPAASLQNVGVIYRVDDCDELLKEARRAAVEDGRDNARDLAEVLEVSRGDLVAASEYSYDPTGYSACTEDPYYYDAYEYEGPRYDPAAPAEVQIVSNVSLTFAIE